MQAATGNLKKVTLELGGKSPNVVFADADTGAIAGAANAIFFNHGQCCSPGRGCTSRRDRFDEVVDGVAEIAKAIKVGPGMEPGTQMGPLVSDEQLRAGHRLPGVRAWPTAPRRGRGGRLGDQRLLRRADRDHQHHART